MRHRRKNISLHDEVEKRAEELIRARGFSGLSDLVQSLIREEYERRHAPRVKPFYSSPQPEQAKLNDSASDQSVVESTAQSAARKAVEQVTAAADHPAEAQSEADTLRSKTSGTIKREIEKLSQEKPGK